MNMSNEAMLEVVELSDRAEKLSHGSAADKSLAIILNQRAGRIAKQGISSDEVRQQYANALVENLTAETRVSEERYTKAFNHFLRFGDTDHSAPEYRDLLAGTQSITNATGSQLGYTIPIKFEQKIYEAMSQTDELLSPAVCDFEVLPTPTLQPKVISGYDLSTISASIVSETVQQTASAFPSVNGRTLKSSITYRLSIAASFEADGDISNVAGKMARAFGIGFARKLGADCISGNGSTQPLGLTTSLTPIYTTQSTGKLTLNDIQTVYFGVNRVYRSSPWCAWLMSDGVLQRLRLATDDSHRPLLSVSDGEEFLMGKRIRVCPSLGAVGGSLALTSTIIFGDLSYFHVRCSRPVLQRSINSSINSITSGEALYVARLRADAALFDPSGGTAPPIISCTVAA